MKSYELVSSYLVFHLIQYEEPAQKKVYMPRYHISEPKIFYENIERCFIVLVYGIIEHTIQYDRNTAYSAEKSVLGQTIQNSFWPLYPFIRK